MTDKRRLIRSGEALAIMSEALRTDGKAQWWDSYQVVPNNERVGVAEVVSIRGSLEHHVTPGCDSYESILERVQAAIDGEEDGQPDVVVLRIDSPGGVVSGLNETVFAIRKMAKDAGIRLIAFVDELAASAAYALACSCEEIVLPRSAIAGSVGVISTLYDQVEADKAMGINFVTLTSGTRKADGHPHVPISAEALSAEQRRIDRLAKQFFRLVSDVRPLNPVAIEKLQAGIFLGKEALNAGLADAILGWDSFISIINDAGSLTNKPLANSGKTGSVSNTQTEKRPMSQLVLKNLVRRTETAIASEKDPKKRKALVVNLAAYKSALEAYKKEKHTIEKHETEEGEEDEADEESEESEESEEKGNETDRKEGDDDSDGDDDDDDDKDKDDEEEDDEAEEEEAKKSASKSLAALAHQVTGKSGRSAVGALAAMIAQGQRAAAEVDAIRKEQRAEKKKLLIQEALNARAVTRSEAKQLASHPAGYVKSFIDMRRDKNGRLRAVINIDDDSVHIPSSGKAGGNQLSAEVLAQIDMAASCAPDGTSREDMRKAMIEAHEKRMLAAANGLGRY